MDKRTSIFASRSVHPALILFVLICLGAAAIPAFCQEDSQIRLPIAVGTNLADSPMRSKAATPYGAGDAGFDTDNTAYFRNGEKLVIEKQDHSYGEISFIDPVKKAITSEVLKGTAWDGKFQSGNFVQNNIVFDKENRAYTIVIPHNSNLDRAVFLYSLDRCRTWHAKDLNAPAAALEGFDTFTNHDGPPSVLTFENVGALKGTRLWLYIFDFENGKLKMPIVNQVTDNSLIVPDHSGGGNCSISVGDKVYVVYPGARPPGDGTKGTCIFINQFDRATGRPLYPTNQPKYLGIAGDTVHLANVEAADAHDQPTITIDKEGILYVGFGAHHGMFKLTTSVAPRDISNWTKPEEFGQPFQHDSHYPNNPYAGNWGAYSYLSWNMDNDQNLHVFSRCEGNGYKFELVQLLKPYKKPWRTWSNGMAHRVIVDPGRKDYVAYRQQVSIDWAGNLYLHFVYWPNNLLPAEVAHFGGRDLGRISPGTGQAKFYVEVPDLYSTTLKSTDNGEHWTIFSAGS
jgi:hypothetical protein